MFYKRLKEQCEINGTTPTTLCKKLGFSNATATHWNNGTLPNGKALILISKEFNCSIDYLLGITDKPEINK